MIGNDQITLHYPNGWFRRRKGMRYMRRKLILILSILVIGGIFVSACSSSQTAPTATEQLVDEENEHGEEEHSPGEHEEGGHMVPEDAAAMPNPVEASAESIASGRELFATNCALCHGETGEGDGPAASGLAMPPANLHEDHVQGRTDGSLFYVISHSKPESPMPAWKDILSEDERWHVINYLRTFSE